jgi:hypothetical protein
MHCAAAASVVRLRIGATVADNTRDVTVFPTLRWGWTAYAGDPNDAAIIASADTIDQLVPLLRELEVQAFTVELGA